MMQEMHFKLMTRVREKRDEILASDMQICPRIKKILDQAVKQSREWRASWDGAGSYLVKSGTRAVTVDLEKRKCDCRIFDLKGIPCAHAVAAIHDRRMQPADFVSEYYKRERYLASYNFSIEALKGEEYWEEQFIEQLLPPEIPKKLRGRPKRCRRREGWESGSSKKGKTPVVSDVPQVQRFSSGRVQHCSSCGKTGHRKPKCPAVDVQEGDTGTKRTQTSCNNVVTRKKLPIRRPRTNVNSSLCNNNSSTVIIPTLASQNYSTPDDAHLLDN